MKEFIVGTNDAGQRLDRWLAKTLPLLPAPLAQKYIRLKRVKLNGRGAKRDVRLVQGDLLQLYINDEFFQTPTPENAFLSLYQPKLTILYEDEHILLVDKRPGLVVHPDETERVNTLITHIQAYLYQKKEWSPYQEGAFAPALCNRIDRNTGGIVIAAKTAEGLRVMNQKIRDRELKKYYLCIVHGTLPRPAGRCAASSSPGAPTRSGPSSPPPGTPCWETANMAASGRTSATAAAIRPCTPTGWSSASLPTPGRWLLWTDSSSRWNRWTS